MTTKERKKAEKVKEIMRLLDCTEEEALDVIRTDEIIDKGGRTEYDLPIAEEKAALKIGRIDERKAKSADNKRGKVRAENPIKSGIIAEIAEFFTEKSQFACENVEITNKERQIAFKIGENEYSLKLTKHRKSKNGG